MLPQIVHPFPSSSLLILQGHLRRGVLVWRCTFLLYCPKSFLLLELEILSPFFGDGIPFRLSIVRTVCSTEDSPVLNRPLFSSTSNHTLHVRLSLCCPYISISLFQSFLWGHQFFSSSPQSFSRLTLS